MAETSKLQVQVPTKLLGRLEKLVYSTMYQEDEETLPIVEFIRNNPPEKLSTLQYKLRKEFNITRSIEGIEHIVQMCDLDYIK